MTESAEQPQAEYSEQRFWEKLKKFAVQAGQQVVERVLILYYTAQRPETPLWSKMVIYSALAYFVLPTDLVPDFTPFVGYSDDLSNILSALTAVAMSVTPEVKATARQKTQEWFNQSPVPPSDCPQAGDTLREIVIE